MNQITRAYQTAMEDEVRAEADTLAAYAELAMIPNTLDLEKKLTHPLYVRWYDARLAWLNITTGVSRIPMGRGDAAVLAYEAGQGVGR